MSEHERPSYVRLTSSSYEPNRLDAALKLFYSASLTAVRRAPGYLGTATLVNRDHHRILALSFWGDGATTNLMDFNAESFSDVLTLSKDWTSPLVRETYSVYVFEIRRQGRFSPGTAQARLTSINVRHQYWDAVVAAGHEAVNALEREQSGFIGAFGLGDRVTGKATFIELWENRAAFRASETTAYRQERAARAVRMLVGVPQHSSYHVEQIDLGPLQAVPEYCDPDAPSVE